MNTHAILCVCSYIFCIQCQNPVKVPSRSYAVFLSHLFTFLDSIMSMQMLKCDDHYSERERKVLLMDAWISLWSVPSFFSLDLQP